MIYIRNEIELEIRMLNEQYQDIRDIQIECVDMIDAIGRKIQRTNQLDAYME
jgi:hypothetical protein